MPSAPNQYYTPRHQLSYTRTANTITRHIPATDMNYARTYTETKNYTVTVKYDGPVNIGERSILVATVPNYYDSNNKEVRRAAEEAVDYGSCADTCCDSATEWPPLWITIAMFSGILTPFGICCCIHGCNVDNVTAAMEKLAPDFMEQAIAKLLEAADNQVDARVGYINQQQTQVTRQAASTSQSVADSNIELREMMRQQQQTIQALLNAQQSMFAQSALRGDGSTQPLLSSNSPTYS